PCRQMAGRQGSRPDRTGGLERGGARNPEPARDDYPELMMDDIRTYLNRRTFLRRGAAGLGSIALASLLDPALFTQSAGAAPAKPVQDRWTGVVHPLAYPQKIKRVIQ